MDDNIKVHYLEYGNTNLITNSGLKNNSQIFAVGDSHTIFFHNSMKIIEHWGHRLTMYNLVRSGIDLFNLGNILGNGHEKYNIKKNDHVIFYFGYNDVHRHIYTNFKDNYKINIDILVTKYIDYILFLKDKYNIIPIISCVYPLPTKINTLNILGSEDLRKKYTKFINYLLEKNCKEKKILFLNIYDKISNNDKIKDEYSKDGIHLDYNNEYIRNYVENKIYELIN